MKKGANNSNNSLTDLMVITQIKDFVYGTDMPSSGIWRVTDYAGNECLAHGAELISTGTAGKLRVHPINAWSTTDVMKWYDLELYPTVAGLVPKGCVFDFIDISNSTITKAHLCIIL